MDSLRPPREAVKLWSGKMIKWSWKLGKGGELSDVNLEPALMEKILDGVLRLFVKN